MSNPIISMLSQQAVGNMPQMQMLSQFAEFRKGWTPEAAQQKIQQMLQSGQINRQQYEQAAAMAERFKSVLK